MSESTINHVVITLSGGCIEQIASNHAVKITVIDSDMTESTGWLYSGKPAEVAVFDLEADDDTVQAILIELSEEGDETGD